MTQPKYKRVGLFGGTFDPIHNGHTKTALEIMIKLKLDHIYFIPANKSPFKTEHITASTKHRVSMCELALQDYPDFSVSEYEVNKEEISYTVDTLHHYNGLFSDDTELFFIMGSDAFLGINQWKNIEEMFSLTHIVVASRKGAQLKPLEAIFKSPRLLKEFAVIEKGKEYKHFTGHSIQTFEIPENEAISSTEIRRRISNQEHYSSFVSSAVADYIKQHALYTQNEDQA